MSRNATEVYKRAAQNMAAELNGMEFCPGEKSSCPETVKDCEECVLKYFITISQKEIETAIRRGK